MMRAALWTAMTAMTAAAAGCGAAGTRVPVADTPGLPGGLIGEGTLMEVALRAPLGAGTVRAGDAFSAVLAEPLHGNAGETVMAGDLTVRGRVADVTPSAVVVAVDRVVHRGVERPFQGEVVALDLLGGMDAGDALEAGAAGMPAVVSPAAAGALPGVDLARTGGTAISLGAQGALPAGTRLVVQLSDMIALE